MSATDRVKALAYGEEPQVSQTVTITGSPERVERVLGLLAMIQTFGGWGHSGTFGIAWDGDGSDKIQIDGLDLSKYHDLCNATCSYGGEIECIGENMTGFVGRAKDHENYLHVAYEKVYPKDE